MEKHSYKIILDKKGFDEICKKRIVEATVKKSCAGLKKLMMRVLFWWVDWGKICLAKYKNKKDSICLIDRCGHYGSVSKR
jgi:hypothetical protein